MIGDLDLAILYFNESAAVGNSAAQHNLAVMHSLGLLNKDGMRDDSMAILYDYFSSSGNSVLAKMSLGYRHLMGINVPKSCEAAAAYYQPAAEEVVKELLKDPVSVVIERARLSDERSRMQPPEQDEDVIQYYQHSAENGDVGAQVALGQVHFYGGRGFEQNPERAARYFQAAAEQGNPTALSALGQMYLQGLGVKQDNDTAFEYLSEAAEKGDASARNGLGVMYLHGQGVEKDLKTALYWFKKAAEQGNPEAQFNLGAMYFCKYH